jgi:hypothetical protein
VEVKATSLNHRIGKLEDRIARDSTVTDYRAGATMKQVEVCLFDAFDPERWDRLADTGDARFDADRGALLFHPDSVQARAIEEAGYCET